MAALSDSDSDPRRMYSWWWDSHISPKNSKWLQENLTDMDTKVKTMIKLIEEDADSFARRAEMYYKKRPELMKLVEEFYRAYRALAERYDHATGVIHQAHRTMAEAFPNQVPLTFPDDPPPNSVSSVDPKNADDLFWPGDFAKMIEGTMRTGLNVDETEKKEETVFSDEILTLKKSLAGMESEKEDVVAQYQQSLDKLSKLEDDLSYAQEDAKGHIDRARNAEKEVVSLKESLSKLEAEKEATLKRYHLCLNMISDLDNIISSARDRARELNEKASRAEAETQLLKDASHNQYIQSLEKIESLENKLKLTEEESITMKDRAQKAEGQCHMLERLNKSLHSEVELLTMKMETQTQELTAKQRELEKKARILKVVKTRNRSLKDEVLKFKKENKNLDQLNASSALSMKYMQNEISSLEETKRNVECKLELQVTQHDALQHEIHSLKEELMNLEQTCDRVRSEKDALLEKTKTLEHIIEKHSVLETSLEQSHVSLSEEKLTLLDENATLMTQLRLARENLQKLAQKNAVMENSLSHAHDELQALKDRSKSLEDSCQLLVIEKLDLMSENEALASQLKDGDCKVDELMTEIGNLHRKLLDVQVACQMLQKQNVEIFEEKQSLADKFLHLKEKNQVIEEENSVLCGEIFDLGNFSSVFTDCFREKFMVLRELSDDLNELTMENVHLREKLQKKEDELKLVSISNDQLKNKTENRKSMLNKNELELQLAKRKMNLIESENSKLRDNLDDLMKKYNELEMIRDDQENRISKLYAESGHLSADNDTLETEAALVYVELQSSRVSQHLYEEKLRELYKAFVGYVDENQDLKSELAAYEAATISLNECISSLENHSNLHAKFQSPRNVEIEGTQSMNHLCRNNLNGVEDTTSPDALLNLQSLQAKVRAIEKAMVEMTHLLVQENMDLHSNLESSMIQIEELKSKNNQCSRNLKPISEAETSLLTKDIMLDQKSECSSPGIKWKQQVTTDSQILELWEAADKDGSIGLTVCTSKKNSPSANFRRVKSINRRKDKSLISEELIGNESSVDKLEISRRSTDAVRREDKRKILEKLNLDTQKLTNLDITIQDLRRKLEMTQKTKRGKAVIECEKVKAQLEEADMNILKLFDVNKKLAKRVGNSSFFDSNSSVESDEDGSASRRRISLQVGRITEKITRLQMVVQKLQFALLKLDDEKEVVLKSTISETRRRILLRDFLNNGRRTNYRRKKSQFCACAQPSTTED